MVYEETPGFLDPYVELYRTDLNIFTTSTTAPAIVPTSSVCVQSDNEINH